eukprot:SAG31_NODE_136_length_23089_cov_8.825924_21_plen_111_part_00
MLITLILSLVGVERVLELLSAELTTVMQLSGTKTISDISADHMVDRGFAARPSIQSAPYILGEPVLRSGSDAQDASADVRSVMAMQEATIAGLRAEVASLKAALRAPARL